MARRGQRQRTPSNKLQLSALVAASSRRTKKPTIPMNVKSTTSTTTTEKGKLTITALNNSELGDDNEDDDVIEMWVAPDLIDKLHIHGSPIVASSPTPASMPAATSPATPSILRTPSPQDTSTTSTSDRIHLTTKKDDDVSVDKKDHKNKDDLNLNEEIAPLYSTNNNDAIRSMDTNNLDDENGVSDNSDDDNNNNDGVPISIRELLGDDYDHELDAKFGRTLRERDINDAKESSDDDDNHGEFPHRSSRIGGQYQATNIPSLMTPRAQLFDRRHRHHLHASPLVHDLIPSIPPFPFENGIESGSRALLSSSSPSPLYYHRTRRRIRRSGKWSHGLTRSQLYELGLPRPDNDSIRDDATTTNNYNGKPSSSSHARRSNGLSSSSSTTTTKDTLAAVRNSDRLSSTERASITSALLNADRVEQHRSPLLHKRQSHKRRSHVLAPTEDHNDSDNDVSLIAKKIKVNGTEFIAKSVEDALSSSSSLPLLPRILPIPSSLLHDASSSSSSSNTKTDEGMVTADQKAARRQVASQTHKDWINPIATLPSQK
jgi:hypothetical protein